MVRPSERPQCFVEVLKGRLMSAPLVPAVPARPVPVVLALCRYYGSKRLKWKLREYALLAIPAVKRWSLLPENPLARGSKAG